MPPRIASLAIAIALGASGAASAQSSDALPDIGSSAGELITPREEAIYGAITLRQIRQAGVLLEDPLIEGWLNSLGYSLVAASDRQQKDFTFFAIRSRAINAFATFGGYVAVNAGLVLTAENQDEVAAVLAHEISHVTQRHIIRAAEAAQKDQLPILLGMLAAVVASAGSGNGDGVPAAIASGTGLMQQRQINFTRGGEQEADRIGIQLLARAGFKPEAMAEFFGRMAWATRAGGEGLPEFLRTHPVTTNRISEARERAERMGSEMPLIGLDLSDQRAQNPLLPRSLATSAELADLRPDPALFEWARERMRVLSAASPGQAVAEYEARRKASPGAFSDGERYGEALALMRSNRASQAVAQMAALTRRFPDNYWAELGLAEAEHLAGMDAQSDARFDALVVRMPGNEAVLLTYARSLNERGTRASGLRAQEVLRPLLNLGAYDIEFQRSFARASELAGDTLRAAEAYAEATFLSGRAEDALSQLQALQQRDDLDYIQRARVDARIAFMMPIAIEMRRQGLTAQRQTQGLAPTSHR
ncbi:MAG: M48 family metalloprotease [Xanthomonadaceae bacterium]|nr:M48 family metalloprotease [Xanthomonadaceae bacterium]